MRPAARHGKNQRDRKSGYAQIANNEHDEYTLLRQDETQTHLLIIKFSGELSEMRFLSTGMTSPFKGLVPELK